MKKIRLSHIFLLCAMIASCSSSQNTQKDSQIQADIDGSVIVKDTFVLPHIPEEITDATERVKYLTLHFWDRFDFSDDALIAKPAVTEQAFVDYINILNYAEEEDARQSYKITLNRSIRNDKMHIHFASLFDKYYNGPNSPFFNPDSYKEVLNILVKSKTLPDIERSKYKFQLAMMNKNNPGERAANFKFTMADGSVQSLHNVRSEYTILIFTNPECRNCAATVERLKKSEEILRALGRNSTTRQMLRIVNIFPENNSEMWHKHLSNYPRNWINGYDKDMSIVKKQLYYIQAFPSLYLLDKDKKTVLKNTSVGEIESFFSSH